MTGTSFMEAAVSADSLAPEWLASIRDSGRRIWQSQSFPTRKTEAWKYTNLRVLERSDYVAPPAPSAEDSVSAAAVEIPGLDGCRLVFINGVYSSALSCGDIPEGVSLTRFSEADEQQAALIQDRLGALVDREQHLFAALNDTRLGDGVFVDIAANADVQTPIHLVWLSVPGEQGFMVSQRLLVRAGSGSRASLIEHFTSDDSPQNSFTNGITEIDIEPNAALDHARLHLEEEHALHIGGVHARLGRDARYNVFHLGLGSALKRIDAVVHHAGEGAHCEMNGIYLPRNQQQIDYHTTIEHAVPRCTTDETFRGIVGDKAKAVFNGRIHIHKDAQQTRAELSNKNLLTSPSAEVDTKPELEIYADDVQCAHGATVAQIDEDALFYLLSRGVGRQEAEVMLSFGFINELVERLPLEPLVSYLRPRLATLFAGVGGTELARHIE